MNFNFWFQKMISSTLVIISSSVSPWQPDFCIRIWIQENWFIYFINNLKILVNQQNSKSNELIKMTRAFQPYLTFTGEPPGFQPNLPPGWRPNCPQVGDLTAPRLAT